MGFGETTDSETERVAKEIVDAAYHVHCALGPGLLESVYEQCLALELTQRSVEVERQVFVPIVYREQTIEPGLGLDLRVARRVVVEVKAVEALHPVYEAQLLTYLKLSNLRLGLLMNFNVPRIKDGIKRVIH